MCGIGGLIGIRDEHQLIARRLLSGLRHRGPDDEGIENPALTVSLVHTRLAILDLSPSGHQPMHDKAPLGRKPNWVVFNGEIFNYRELRRELAAKGWSCEGRSDTSVILAAYRAWGESFVGRLRGMFAFGLYDSACGILHLARDRLGIKPLYLFRTSEGGVIFASELRALLGLGSDLVAPNVDPRALESYFAQGAVCGVDTIVAGVTMLEPATHLRFEADTGREIGRKRYWQLPLECAAPGARDAEVSRLSSLVRETLRLHLSSDAPLGIFLSGGIDSSAMVTLAREADPGVLRTLNLSFEFEDANENKEAAAIAEAFGAEHSEVRLTGAEVLARLEPALGAVDQPTVDGFNTYFVSQAAREAGLTVALSGLGGDELFGGYASFRDVPRLAILQRSRSLQRFIGLAARMIPNRAGTKLAELPHRSVSSLSLYLLRRELFMPHERRLLQALPKEMDPMTGVSLKVLDELNLRSETLDEVNKISLYEIELYMRNMLLRDGDIFSMAAPIEYRVPFLDHVLVEAIFRLPGAWKKPDPRPKALLVDIVGPNLPKAVWQRAKRGFALPWERWFSPEGALFKVGRDAAYDSKTWRDLGLHPGGVSRIWERFATGDRRISALQPLAFVTLRDFSVRHRLSAA
jgi:asparagine synthase (glutamine-hydrolysing)